MVLKKFIFFLVVGFVRVFIMKVDIVIVREEEKVFLNLFLWRIFL